MIKLRFFVIIPAIFAFVAKPSTFEITVIGNYTDALNGKSEEQVSLGTLNFTRKTFGIGLEAKTNAEILVYKGKIYKTSVGEELIHSEKIKNPVASYLVYTSVQKWDDYPLPGTIRSMNDLEAEIAKVIHENNYVESIAIPFLLVGRPISANWHLEYSPDSNREINNSGFFFEDMIKAAGFYSDQHSIITGMNSKIHVHVTNKRKEIIGHLDDIKMAGEMTLWMPRMK